MKGKRNSDWFSEICYIFLTSKINFAHLHFVDGIMIVTHLMDNKIHLNTKPLKPDIHKTKTK